MSIILSLDSSTKVCSAAIHENGELIGQQVYHLQKSHSNLLPIIIQQLVENCELQMKDLKAIALSAGPGSYTGLRIGTAAAKGLCYSLKLPLIAIDTLDTMIAQIKPYVLPGDLILPMIDARRMEVYIKAVTSEEELLWNTKPLIVDETTFDEFKGRQLWLLGNGAAKLKEFFSGSRYKFISDIHPSAAAMGTLAEDKFENEQFEDIAYFEPDYLKEYRTNVPSQKFKL